MKFLGLKIVIKILELWWLAQTTAAVAMIWLILANTDLSNNLWFTPVAIAEITALVGALVSALFLLAFAQLLKVLICIERNTAPVPVDGDPPKRAFAQWRRECFQPVVTHLSDR